MKLVPCSIVKLAALCVSALLCMNATMAQTAEPVVSVVFAGDIKGIFRAHDAKTGKELWKFNTGSGISAAPISYTLDGKQYVAVTSGRTQSMPAFFGKIGEKMVAASPEGGTLYVFSLD